MRQHTEKIECQECGKIFSKRIPKSLEVRCPQCGSTDVYPLSFFSSKAGKAARPERAVYILVGKSTIAAEEWTKERGTFRALDIGKEAVTVQQLYDRVRWQYPGYAISVEQI